MRIVAYAFAIDSDLFLIWFACWPCCKADKKWDTAEMLSTAVSNYVKFEMADKRDVHARAVSLFGKRQKLDNIF